MITECYKLKSTAAPMTPHKHRDSDNAASAERQVAIISIVYYSKHSNQAYSMMMTCNKLQEAETPVTPNIIKNCSNARLGYASHIGF